MEGAKRKGLGLPCDVALEEQSYALFMAVHDIVNLYENFLPGGLG
jgi:hypothetical protein